VQGIRIRVRVRLSYFLAIMTNRLRTSAYHGTLVFLYGVCLAGIALSIWAHILSFIGIDPRTRFPQIWIVELTLTAVLIPLVVVLFRRGLHEDPLRLSRWSWRLIFVLTAYYAFHFYLFIVRASDELTSDITWQMFSAGWILLFAVAFAFYRGVLTRLMSGERNVGSTPQSAAAL
jgi:hypothetical protein